MARKSGKKTSSTRLALQITNVCCGWAAQTPLQFHLPAGKISVLLFCNVKELFLWCWPQSVLLTDNPQFLPTTERACFYWLPSDCLLSYWIFPSAHERGTVPCCAPLFIFRAVTWRHHSSYMRLVRGSGDADWRTVVAVAARGEAAGRGRCYKCHFLRFGSSTLEEESDVRGPSQRGSKRPPSKRLYLPTGVSFAALNRPGCLWKQISLYLE